MISGQQEFFFIAIWWAGYFFPVFSHKLSITSGCTQFFFSDKSLQEIFFQNHPRPPSRVKWWAPNEYKFEDNNVHDLYANAPLTSHADVLRLVTRSCPRSGS